ncbi:MAG: sodium:calcium antiporter [Candidatus Poseidoniales archaeon]|uniref:Sodium/calcium exchanger (YrbG) n=1 Tax=uncultured Poseidoniia archaeon TaxID=1697135 RepID=A0A1B1TB12_9ARCH|nr:sodium/calcium exchanger (yrbG) [uncultured Candidatus Thalassoarchaea sp.]MDA7602999.1 calcium/sodium antiporter [Euryarchaeota archaeon]RCH73005.1 MAG: sodium:calcium antiporter [Candidatus Poseidoniales archaeon]|tara:strand:- start:43 stop:1008 length:966 start_codon:yes stop_codon:yes gene_type:complete
MLSFLSDLPDLVLVILGFIFLIFGGESVVQGAITIARKMNVSPLLIGFTIVAVGTSLPELAVTLNAVSSNNQDLVDLAVGGVLGSNVANVMLVLGTAAMLGACDKPGVGIKKDAMAVIMASIILLFTVLMGEVTQIIGILMVIALISYYAYSYNYSKKLGLDEELEETWMGENMLLAMIVTILGGAMIVLGAELLIEGSKGIADSFGISESIVGLSVIALGTSLPELAVTMVAALRGHKGVAIGNVLGSNVINILGILGISSAYAGGIIVSEEFAGRDIWIVMITSGLVAIMLLNERKITKTLGVTMVIGYLSYMVLLYTL